MNINNLLSLTLCLGVCSLHAAFAAPVRPVIVKAEAAATDAAALSVSLLKDEGPRRINLLGADPFVTVVIRNDSNRPQRFWTENNGTQNLTLELLAIDNKPFVPPVVVRRPDEMWLVAYDLPESVTLEPGKSWERYVRLGKKDIVGLHYRNILLTIFFPTTKSPLSHKVRMRAVFATAQAGRTVSAANDYQILW